VVREHQVLFCPACYPDALADLTRCSRCDNVRLIKRLGQIECLGCRLTRDADAEQVIPVARGEDSGLAAEVASALARVLGPQ
jgi:hypothetical protein